MQVGLVCTPTQVVRLLKRMYVRRMVLRSGRCACGCACGHILLLSGLVPVLQGESGEPVYQFSSSDERVLRDVVQSGNTAGLALTLQAAATFLLGKWDCCWDDTMREGDGGENPSALKQIFK